MHGACEKRDRSIVLFLSFLTESSDSAGSGEGGEGEGESALAGRWALQSYLHSIALIKDPARTRDENHGSSRTRNSKHGKESSLFVSRAISRSAHDDKGPFASSRCGRGYDRDISFMRSGTMRHSVCMYTITYSLNSNFVLGSLFYCVGVCPSALTVIGSNK